MRARRDNQEARWTKARQRLVEALADEGELSEAALAALTAVPRHRFVPPSHRADSYANRPLPIGRGQTISQPFMVGWLVDAVRAGPGCRVLEIGTGCGYQAAVLAATGAQVWSIEIRRPLAEAARARLDALGLGAVTTRVGDGAKGWPEAAPFDGIVLTAAPSSPPTGLLDQVAIGGCLVAPVGPQGDAQVLIRQTRVGDDEWTVEALGGCRFVPLVDERFRAV
ncbi:MAG: protein-L-isoaspartate(D-aspartate) O-methyltransferase [Armatimonadetes bacterium]|nr:protein-L-isoaspartate(D-aspartate) O-methyltransferase [Armatimonadota bacterium]